MTDTRNEVGSLDTDITSPMITGGTAPTQPHWLNSSLRSRVRDYGNWQFVDIIIPAPPIYYTQVEEKSQRTTNEHPVDYDFILRRELDKQTEILKSKIDDAKAQTISSLQSECSLLREQNNTLQDQYRILEKQITTLTDQLNTVTEQNTKMAQLLSKRYTARQLFVASSFILLAMIATLVLYIVHGIIIIDPFLAWLGLFLSVGFICLAGIRHRQEKGRDT